MGEMDFSDEDFWMTLCVEGTDREPSGVEGDWACWKCDCGHTHDVVYSFANNRIKILLCAECVAAFVNHYLHRRPDEYLTLPDSVKVDSYKRKPISAKKRKKIFERDAYRCR